MFHYDGGLKLTSIDLAVDVPRRQPRGFISHAHADHIARHGLAFCTPETGRLYHHRLGVRPVVEMPYGQTLEWSDWRLRTHPAGHILGSAMLWADNGGQTLLYTGDFKLGASATCAAADPPPADILVMECTYGDPAYRLPPREESIARLLEVVYRALAEGATPVIYAYALGKAQEVTKILTDAGVPVLQHPRAHAISRIYEECGCSLGACEEYDGRPREGWAVVTPPNGHRAALQGVYRRTTIAVSGWAVDPGSRRRLGAEHAIPLSDHADYNELLELAERVNPKLIYCTHGPGRFAERLRDRGFEAHVLGTVRQAQLRLFT